MTTFDKPVALITGASSGLGRAIAAHLHRAGWRVFGTSRSAQPGGCAPEGFALLRMDVDCDESVGAAVQTLLEATGGRLDLLVNCAGFGIAGSVEDTTVEEARRLFETNLFGVWRVCRAALPAMRRRRAGTIINVSSLAGLISIPFQAAYSASKYALEGLTEALSAEARPFGVRVVLVEPGDFRTGFTDRREHVAAACNPAYAARMRASVAVMERDERGGADPAVAARLVERIAHTRNPRLRYIVGLPFAHIAVLLKRVVPARLFEWGLMKYYRI
ncbi:MAG TPA: SDR family oxidoreductase [Roseiflexaceae bacterium]|nr:SDR family oxidoreductase [Roseiflexaceae bacterium]